MKKKCLDCKKFKLLKFFQKRRGGDFGKSGYCKSCISLRTSEYHKSPQGKTLLRKNTYNWKFNHPERKLIYGARSRAKKRGVPCTIKDGDVIIPDVCPILGIKLERNAKFGKANSPSLDCIIPALGYVPGNVAVISRRANTIKNDASLEDLKLIVSWFESIRGKESNGR